MPDNKRRIMVEVVKAWQWECMVCHSENMSDTDPLEVGGARCKCCGMSFMPYEFLKVEGEFIPVRVEGGTTEQKYTVISGNRFRDGSHLICSRVTVDGGYTIEDYFGLSGKDPSEVVILEGAPKILNIRKGKSE